VCQTLAGDSYAVIVTGVVGNLQIRLVVEFYPFIEHSEDELASAHGR